MIAIHSVSQISKVAVVINYILPRFADDRRKQTSKTLMIIAHRTFNIAKRPITDSRIPK